MLVDPLPSLVCLSAVQVRNLQRAADNATRGKEQALGAFLQDAASNEHAGSPIAMVQTESFKDAVGQVWLEEFCSRTSVKISRSCACCSGRCRHLPPAAAAAQPPPYPMPPAATNTNIAAVLRAAPPRIAQDYVQLDAAVKVDDTLYLGEHKLVLGEQGVSDIKIKLEKIR